ncbi:hypothetical protein GCM10009665_26630 [Kitasatospora nipponensis]|uniref:Uncharacterized protein n=1 Tax=Kitasatospora nipponensis TaxID=258049 RepID=A0ABN1W4H8_9ACTN
MHGRRGSGWGGGEAAGGPASADGDPGTDRGPAPGCDLDLDQGLDQGPARRLDLDVDRDGILVLMRVLAEHGVVAALFAADRTSPVSGSTWEFRAASGSSAATALRPGVVTGAATAGECVRLALPLLAEAGLPVGGVAGAPVPEDEQSTEGIGMLVLDWLVEQGMSVFLKADGGRRTPGWTLIVRGGPLADMLRFDGPEVGRCLRRLLLDLRGHGLVVPV